MGYGGIMIFFESKNCEGSDPPVFDLESVTSGEAATSPEVRRFLRVFRAATRITLKNFSKDSAVCVGQRPHLHCSPKNCPMPMASSYLVCLIRHSYLLVMCTTCMGECHDTYIIIVKHIKKETLSFTTSKYTSSTLPVLNRITQYCITM